MTTKRARDWKCRRQVLTYNYSKRRNVLSLRFLILPITIAGRANMSIQSMIDPALQDQTQHHLVAPDPRRWSVTTGSSKQPNSGDDILEDNDIAVERAQTWTAIARFGFNSMLASEEYKNKLRLKPDKMERIIYFLTTPDAKSREKDRPDAQAKHQAQQWLYQNGILYRKESRLQHPRRHVSVDEVFDVITAEHLRSGHHGRDKMLKVLEAKYIGYTKDELMYVLDHCLICSSKHIRGAAARRRENKHSGELDHEVDVAPNR